MLHVVSNSQFAFILVLPNFRTEEQFICCLEIGGLDKTGRPQSKTALAVEASHVSERLALMLNNISVDTQEAGLY